MPRSAARDNPDLGPGVGGPAAAGALPPVAAGCYPPANIMDTDGTAQAAVRRDRPDVAVQEPGGPLPVLTLGMAPDDAAALAAIRDAGRFRYHPLGSYSAVADPELCRPAEVLPVLVAAARRLVPAPAGVIAFDDYPASPLAVLLAAALGLPGPSVESALICHHKYWSRLKQREAAPESVPPFRFVELDRRYGPSELGLAYPFWLKPVKSSLSHLGFRVGSPDEFEHARAAARRQLPSYAAAFKDMLRLAPGLAGAGLPPAAGDGLIAEGLVGGWQVTLEGYVQRGSMGLLGITDSICVPGHPSFSRFVYPSALPAAVQEAMAAIAERVMRHIGFDDGQFCAEFFYDEARRRIWLIEINPRFCPQFSDLYAKVDGTSGHQVLVELAAGLTPSFRRGQGPHRIAASFVRRRFADARVVRAPGDADLARLAAALPDCHVELLAREGDRLSELAQDSYSFRYAVINLGAADATALAERYALACRLLPYEFAPAAA
jgi:hypothetical protein